MSLTSSSSNAEFLPAPLRAIVPYWLLAFAVFVAYSNIYDNVFLFDDSLLIEINSYLRGWGHIGDILTGSTTSGAHIAGGFYRPMQILLYLFAFHLGDGGTFWFHILNLSIHMANTCLVYRLGAKLGFEPWGVFLAALVWGVHPIHTEAVTYMSATADPLFAFFCLASIVLLLPDFTTRKILLTFPLFLLGLLTKETTVMFPLLVMVCLFFVSPQRFNFRTYFRTVPLWIVSLTYAYWRTHAQGFDGPQTYDRFYQLPEFSTLKQYADHPIDRVYTFFATLPSYLDLLVWPTGLHMERSFSIFTSIGNLSVLGGIGLFLFAAAHIVYSYRNRQQNPGVEMSWGLLWFAAAHAPDTGLLVPMNSLFLEHWMYLPSAGLFLGTAQTLVKLMQARPRWLPVSCCIAALVFAAFLSVKTYDQNKIWRDPPSFYNNIFLHGEASARARNNLALYYSNNSQFPEALEQFQQAIKTSDTYAETRYNLALTYMHQPDRLDHTQEIIANLKRSLEIDPRFFRSYQMLGDVYDNLLNDKEQAAVYHAQATALFRQH